MQSATQASPTLTTMLWVGRIMTIPPVLFLLFDSVIHLMPIAAVVQSFNQLGYPASLALIIGIVGLVCLIVYVIPATSVLGAILLTGYLGGAVVTHVRIGDAPFTILFPIILGLLIWGGLYLREERLRAIFPLRS